LLIEKEEYMEIEAYIDSMLPPMQKQRRKLGRTLRDFQVEDKGRDILKLRMPKGFVIPYRDRTYGWCGLMDTVMQECYFGTMRDDTGLVRDEYGQLWLRIHTRDSWYDDDTEVSILVKDAGEAKKPYLRNGPYNGQYFDYHLREDVPEPQFRYSDAPCLYLVSDEMELTCKEAFHRLVECNKIL